MTKPLAHGLIRLPRNDHIARKRKVWREIFHHFNNVIDIPRYAALQRAGDIVPKVRLCSTDSMYKLKFPASLVYRDKLTDRSVTLPSSLTR